MERLIIRKVDESRIQIECSQAVAYELRDYYTIKAKNYKFHPMYKNRVWDGSIRLFDIRTNTLPFGLTIRTAVWAKKRGYDCEIEFKDEYLSLAKIEDKTFDSWIDTLKLPGHIVPRDYQVEALRHGYKTRRCVMELPTASGKSLVIYMLAKSILYKDGDFETGIIIVPTTSLVEQLHSDFMEYESMNNTGDPLWARTMKMYSGATNTHLVRSSNIYISTWQTLHSAVKNGDTSLLSKIKWIIGDEAHGFTAKSLKQIMESCPLAHTRIGVTGSVDDDKASRMTVEGNFGPIRKIVSSRELIDQGHLSNIHIKGIVLKHPQHIIDTRKTVKWTYRQEVDYMMFSEERNDFIVKLAFKTPGNTLVLYNEIEKHGDYLKAKLDYLVENQGGKEVFYIHGGTKTDERERIRKYVNDHDNCIILASYGTYSTGINIPNLQNAILALGFKSKIRNLQSLGRTLRLDGKTNHATIYDICDDIRSSEKDHGYLHKHFMHRMELYYKEGFDVSITKIPLS